jgi:branched-chain amino acid transport system ATP-binding protein
VSGALLDVRGLSVRYDRADVLADVSLSVARGAVTCVLGPNGAGKSTLLKTIAGALRPRLGTIELAGDSLAGRSAPQVVRHGAVLVPEGHRVFGSLSVRDNLLTGAATRTDRAGIAADLAIQFAQFPILRERSGQAAGTLSGGERQMLAIARALMARPRLLMLDEPSLGLAPRKVAEVFALIGQLRAQSLGILLVEQNAHQALRIADHVCLLAQGRVVYSGPPAGLADSEPLVSAFFGADFEVGAASGSGSGDGLTANEASR